MAVSGRSWEWSMHCCGPTSVWTACPWGMEPQLSTRYQPQPSTAAGHHCFCASRLWQEQEQEQKRWDSRILFSRRWRAQCNLRRGETKQGRFTSINEIPTLHTSEWMPYCSPDIRSGWRDGEEYQKWLFKHWLLWTKSTYLLLVTFASITTIMHEYVCM